MALISMKQQRVELNAVTAINLGGEHKNTELIQLVFQLEQKIEDLSKSLKSLTRWISDIQNHLYYMPGAQGAKEAKEDFIQTAHRFHLPANDTTQ